jgi:serine kinase of HPr protein (carbohydrate metabolism regulator)
MTGVTVHASCVAIDGRAVLLAGPSGSGKSDLALRLIDRGAVLVSDDYTELMPDRGRLLASPPEPIAGRIEVRGVGILEREWIGGVSVCLLVDLSRAADRLPEPETRMLAGVAIPVIGLSALEASAAIKVEAALNLLGLDPS